MDMLLMVKELMWNQRMTFKKIQAVSQWTKANIIIMVNNSKKLKMDINLIKIYSLSL